MLHHLRTPARVEAGVETLAAEEAELLQHADERREVLAAAPVGVMIVVRPADAELVLPGLLRLGGPVAARPVRALGGEEEVAHIVAADSGDARVNETLGLGEALGRVVEVARAGAQALADGAH